MMKLPCDPQRDLAPLTLGMSFPNVLVVHAGVGVKTFAEFIALAKKKPRTLDFASTGAGSASHLAGELLNQMAGIDTVHIPYQGGAPALQDLLGGRVASYYSTWSTAQPHVETGKLIALASTGPARPEFRFVELCGQLLRCCSQLGKGQAIGVVSHLLAFADALYPPNSRSLTPNWLSPDFLLRPHNSSNLEDPSGEARNFAASRA